MNPETLLPIHISLIPKSAILIILDLAIKLKERSFHSRKPFLDTHEVVHLATPKTEPPVLASVIQKLKYLKIHSPKLSLNAHEVIQAVIYVIECLPKYIKK